MGLKSFFVILLALDTAWAARITQDDADDEALTLHDLADEPEGSSALEQSQNQSQVPGHDPWSVARLQFSRGCLLRRAYEIDLLNQCDPTNGTRCCAAVLREKLEVKHQIRSRYSGRGRRVRAYFRSSTYRTLWSNNTALKEELAEHNFTWKDEKQECDAESANASVVLSRVEVERDVCELDESSKVCSERPGLYCPEGHSPAYRRGFSNQRFAGSYSLSFLVANPIDTAIATAVVLAFTPTMPIATAIASGYAFKTFTPVPFDFITAAGLSAAYATERRTCKCFPDDCTYDEEADQCRVSQELSTANPYSWLPYPGTRCAKVPLSKGRGFTCNLEACGAEDFFDRRGDGVEGHIGHSPTGALLNCLAEKGHDPTTSFGVQDLLPDGSNNTAANRALLYASIGFPAQ